MQAADDDDEALEPHAGVHAHADEVNDEDISPAPLEPEKLRRKHVAEDHADPPVPPVGTEDAIVEREPLVLIAAVPGDEKLHRVGVADDRAGQQNDLRHLVDVLRRDDVVQLENGARRDHQREHHGEPAEDRARDEIRRENRRVPGRNDRRGEVEGHDAVHRKHQRRGKTGQKQIRHFVMAPVAVRAAPAEGENAVEEFLDLRRRAIAQGRQIGNQARVPKQHRDREIGRDREHVPEQRAAEVRPDAVVVRHRREDTTPSRRGRRGCPGKSPRK